MVYANERDRNMINMISYIYSIYLKSHTVESTMASIHTSDSGFHLWRSSESTSTLPLVIWVHFGQSFQPGTNCPPNFVLIKVTSSKSVTCRFFWASFLCKLNESQVISATLQICQYTFLHDGDKLYYSQNVSFQF